MGSTPVECTTLKPLKTSGLHKEKPANRRAVSLGNYCRFLSKNTAFCVFTGTLLALDSIRFAQVLSGLRAVPAFHGGSQLRIRQKTSTARTPAALEPARGAARSTDVHTARPRCSSLSARSHPLPSPPRWRCSPAGHSFPYLAFQLRVLNRFQGVSGFLVAGEALEDTRLLHRPFG